MITPFGEIPNALAARMSLQEQHEWFARRVSRRTVIKGLATAAGGLVLPTLWTPPARASSSTRVRGRHLAFGADPATTMVVDFAVEGDLTSARVEASTESGAGAAVDASLSAVVGSQRRYGRGMLSGLTPGSSYSYRILLDGQPSARGAFKTASTGPAAFRFTAFGDQGTDSTSKSILAQVAALNPLVHLLAGDLCYADTTGKGGVGDQFNSAIWDRWLDQNDEVAGALPWMSVPGNHEMEPGFGMHGYAGYLTRVFPGGSSPLEIPVATTFRIGAVGFVGLDSNDVSNEIPANRGWTQHAQTAWLERTLADLRSGDSPVDFIVAFLHHAPYSTNNTHASEGGIREAWVPLFDTYSVDLVISGHNHAYERVLPLRRGKVTSTDPNTVDSSTGTTYITAGGGGASSGTNPVFIPYPNKTRVSTPEGQEVENESWSVPTKTAEHLVLSVDVKPADAAGGTSTMTIRAVDASGQERDQVVLNRKASARADGGVGNRTAWLVAGSGAAAVAAVGTGAFVRRRQSTTTSAGQGDAPSKTAGKQYAEK